MNNYCFDVSLLIQLECVFNEHDLNLVDSTYDDDLNSIEPTLIQMSTTVSVFVICNGVF